jgi:carotenoid cleavage dioxygenase-like enzyme
VRNLVGSIFDSRLKNPSNTRLLSWAGRLISCFETSIPYELSERDLATVGEWTFGGMIRGGQPATAEEPWLKEAVEKGAGHAFTAHSRVDGEAGTLVGWTWRSVVGLGKPNALEVGTHVINRWVETVIHTSCIIWHMVSSPNHRRLKP